MDHEVYVTRLLTSSERARMAVASTIGHLTAADSRALLRDLDRLRAAFSTPPENPFADLADKVRQEFAPAAPLSRITAEDLRRLTSLPTAYAVATALGYRNGVLFSMLFDAAALAGTLATIGCAVEDPTDAEALFLRVIERMPSIEIDFGLLDGNLTYLVEEQHWLTATARTDLAAAAEKNRLPADLPAVLVLATLIHLPRRAAPAGPPAPRFDSLALVELKRRLTQLAEDLRSDARDRARLAAQLVEDRRAVAYLPAWLELYEFGAVAEGMISLLTGAGSFADLVRNLHYTVPEIDGNPVSSERLVIQSEVTYGIRRRHSLDIACLLQGQDEPSMILRLRDLKRTECEVVKDVVRRLAGGDMSPTGESLGQRLLNTRVPLREGLAGYLRAALHLYGTETVQCAVLTGHRQPVIVPEPWKSQLNSEIPYQAPASSADALLPPCCDVEDGLRSEAIGRHLRVIPLDVLEPFSGSTPGGEGWRPAQGRAQPTS